MTRQIARPLLLGLALLMAAGMSASAASAAPVWSLHVAGADRVAPGDTFEYRISPRNVGDTETDGSAQIDVTLPSGVVAVEVISALTPSSPPPVTWSCGDVTGESEVHCVAPNPSNPSFVFPTLPGEQPFETLRLKVAVDPAATGALAPASFAVSGGGAANTATASWSVLASPVPDFKIKAFDGAVLDESGDAYTQAGGHPATASVSLELSRAMKQGFAVADGGDLRDANVEIPAGLVGNPRAVPVCPKELRIPTNKQAGDPAFELPGFCPLNTIVGIADVTASGAQRTVTRMVAPVFNLEPPPGVAAQFGFSIADQKTLIDAHVRTDGDHGVTVRVRNANQAKSVLANTVTLWGVPADPSHDRQRCVAFFNSASLRPDVDPKGFAVDLPLPECGESNDLNGLSRQYLLPNPANVQPQAFLTNPTACTPAGVGLETSITADSWNLEAGSDSASFVSHDTPGYPLPMDQWGGPLGPTGCAGLPFDPTMSARPDTSTADAPSGLSFDLSFPTQNLLNPTGLAQAHLKRAAVTLPAGMSISPSAADGLQACSDAQSSVGTLNAAACPEGAKIGTVEATTPLLAEKLTGGVYIGSQKSDDPASGEMFRLWLTLNSPERGVFVKLSGQVFVDPDSGRVTTVFDNNPQVPVERLSLKLKSGPRAPLAMPSSCGAKSIDAVFESWGGQTVTRSDSFAVDCPGQTGFAPSFEAGTVSPIGGAFSPFAAQIVRPDRQQFLSGVRVDMPKGLVAKLRGVPLCGDLAAANGGCPDGSRIGTATVGAGPGSNPFYLAGSVYLTEGYKGAPYGLSVQVRVQAGPFDLGTVIVRQAVRVDPRTAELSVVSDPLPQIVKGVPVRLRSAVVNVDRPQFAINPTSCRVKQIGATLTSIDGAVHRTTSRFQAGECQALGFRPKLALRLTGKRQRRTGGHPGLATVLTQGAGQANIEGAEVRLPRSIALDPRNSTDPKLVCDYDKGLAADCPAASVIGRARAQTPLLERPLVGDVHLVQGIRFGPTGNRIRTTPTLLVKLRGEVAIDLRARTTVKSGRLVTIFDEVPDARVSRFDLSIRGGKRKGILVVTRTRRARIDLCDRRQTASVDTDAQNGKQADFDTGIKTPCASKRKAGGRRSARGR